jgi:hypothetical protein
VPKGKWAHAAAAGVRFARIWRESAAAALYAGKAHLLVVSGAPLRIAEHRVCVVDQGHALCSVGVAGVQIGMVVPDQAAIRCLDYAKARIRTDFKNLVQRSVQATLSKNENFDMLIVWPQIANRSVRIAARSLHD